ncbi:Major facilitator superfamily domain-containing protein 8 [Orchesella cincta]|uniref:Major facilitator superfamily domain-containing protein 8 n=1 Tax=Orchesella cincta TaxID=48709 RepID=A0A1D2MZH0_ORCCI|nr:Major facilitator superfamily domain-containing protein 8 [Orchesella cincta]
MEKQILTPERQPLNNTRPGSNFMLHTTYTLETSEERRRRKYSLWIMYYTTLLQSIGGSIVITGMWPYLQQLDENVKKEWLGWVVAANPLGQLIFSPIIGWWCNRIDSVRVPSLFCLILFIVSNCWYGVLPIHGSNAVWFILAARFLVGISSGSITACRTFVTQGTLLAERTQAISYLSLSQALGFVLGPVGQLVLKPLGSIGIPMIEDKLSLNMYTAVGWLTAALGLTNLILLHPKLFGESDIAVREAQMKAKLAQRNGGSKLNLMNDNNRLKHLRPDYTGLSVIVITFFIVFFNFVLLETLGTPVSIDQFGWSHETAITNVGLTMIISSVVSTSIFFLIPRLAKKIDERMLLVGFGIVPMIAGRLFFFPFSGDSPPMREFGCINRENGTVIQNVTQVECLGSGYHWDVLQHGCPASQTWCFEMPALDPIIVAIGYAICTLGFPFCIALTQTIFSKMIGPRPQGLWMGALTSISSLSRVIGPIFVTFIYTNYGTIVTSATATGLMILTFLLLVIVYKRLIPLVDPRTTTVKA